MKSLPLIEDGRIVEHRNTIVCPRCLRVGRVHRTPFVRVIIEHRCSGPWTLQTVERDKTAPWGSWRAVFFDLTHDDIVQAGWRP